MYMYVVFEPVCLRLQIVQASLLDDPQLATLEDVSDDLARFERDVDGSGKNLRHQRNGSSIFAAFKRGRCGLQERVRNN